MVLYVFSDSGDTGGRFSGAGECGFEVRVLPRKKLLAEIKKASHRSLMYLDVSGFNEGEVRKALRALGKNGLLRFAVIDPDGVVKDAASVFHAGACDYIGNGVCPGTVTPARIIAALNYTGPARVWEDDLGRKECDPRNSYVLSGTDWSSVRSGTEYTFWFVFIELDNQRELKKQMSEAHLKEAQASFRSYVEKAVAPANGRTWIWSDFGGLVLFPFNGESTDAIVCAFRLMLSRKIFVLEESRFNKMITYRVAVHIGNTVYRSAGDTGTLVSDSINSIFHLSQKYAEPDGLYLTSDVHHLVPPGLKKMLLQNGSYEGRDIYRMRRLQ